MLLGDKLQAHSYLINLITKMLDNNVSSVLNVLVYANSFAVNCLTLSDQQIIFKINGPFLDRIR